jgi:hypothetical protein
VLDREVLVLQAAAMVGRTHQQLIERLRDVDLAGFGVAAHLRTRGELLLKPRLQLGHGHIGTCQNLWYQSVLLCQKGIEQVLHIDLLVAETDGDLASGLQRQLGALCHLVHVSHGWFSCRHIISR